MFLTARTETEPSQFTRLGTVEAPRHTLYERLHVLGLPNDAISLIMKASYKGRDGVEMPIFAIARNTSDPTGYTWNFPEIIEIVHVYDQMRLSYPTVFEKGEERQEQGLTVPSVPLATLFKNHIDSLVLNRAKNERLGTMVRDHTVFEAPALEEMRRQEAMKDLLMNRKRIPLKGKRCKRCNQEEVYQIALWTRSGDEPAVLHNRCGKCDALWKE